MDHRIISMFVFALFMGISIIAAAQEPEPEGASEAYKNGTRLFSEEKYSEAAREFKRAYDLKPSWKILYNIAQSEAAAKHHGLALDAFERYLSQGGDDISEDRRAEVVREIGNLTLVVGNIEVRCDDGLEVYVDGDLRGTTPLPGKLRVSAGITHDVQIRDGGTVVHEQQVSVGGKQTMLVEVKPSSEDDQDAPAKGALPSKDPVEQRDPLRTLGWVVTGTGGALVIGGAISGAVALSKNKALVDDCEKSATGCDDSHYDDRDSRDNLATASTVLFSVGAAAVAAGVTMLIISKKKGESEKETASRLSVFPTVGDRSGAITLGGTF